MKKFFANVWTKRVCSVVSVGYAVCVCYLCYFSLFYNIHISARSTMCLMLSAVSLISLVVMLYTRRQILTRLSSFIILPAMLPVVLFYFGEWGLILPIIFTGVTILLLSGAGEGAKTAVGTIVLLMYVFGALGYFMLTSLFVTTADETVIGQGVSPTGKYRYRVVNTVDASNGSTAVYIEPNDADKTVPYATFTLKDMERIVDLKRPLLEEVEIGWTTVPRKEITEQLTKLSKRIRVNLSPADREKIGCINSDHYILTLLSSDQKKHLGLKSSDMSTILLDELNSQQLYSLGISKDETGKYYVTELPETFQTALGKPAGTKTYLSELSERQLKYYNVELETALYLNDLTDEQLALLGVPETGDVMTMNGEVCFRYYIAELENYFDVDTRKISFNILG